MNYNHYILFETNDEMMQIVTKWDGDTILGYDEMHYYHDKEHPEHVITRFNELDLEEDFTYKPTELVPEHCTYFITSRTQHITHTANNPSNTFHLREPAPDLYHPYLNNRYQNTYAESATRVAHAIIQLIDSIDHLVSIDCNKTVELIRDRIQRGEWWNYM